MSVRSGIGDRLQAEMPKAFGGKTMWLALGTDDPDEVAAGLGLVLAPASWRAAVDAGHQDRALITPPITTPTGTWVLVMSITLNDDVDVAQLSRDLALPVQFFGTHRDVEWHRWAWATPEELRRDFELYDGVPRWSGTISAVERAHGLPTTAVPDVSDEAMLDHVWEVVSEDVVLNVAAAWSVNPQTLPERRLGSPWTAVLPTGLRVR